MGGHGAFISTLRNPGLYKSVSAFAPICNPVACPWGEKAFSGYLGTEKSKWSEWDATELVKKYNGPPLTLFIDQVKSSSYFLRICKLLILVQLILSVPLICASTTANQKLTFSFSPNVPSKLLIAMSPNNQLTIQF